MSCHILLTLLVMTMAPIACGKADVDPQLTVSVSEVLFPKKRGTSEIILTCNDQWIIDNPATSWSQLTQTTGNGGSTSIPIETEVNGTGTTRSVVSVISSNNGRARRVTVTQGADFYPMYNTSPKAPDATGMSSTAEQLAAKMKLGWNLYKQ